MPRPTDKPARLVLEDGRQFDGFRFGADRTVTGEAVFNTAMAGYQEILGDPSYAGQLVTMTYPMIGNYGIASEDFESQRIYCPALIVKEPSRIASNWRHEKTLGEYLSEHEVVGFYGIDTRALVRHLRDRGSMRAVIGNTDDSIESLVERAKEAKPMAGRDLAREVTTPKTYEWTTPPVSLSDGSPSQGSLFERRETWNVVVYDFGVKRNILRSLVAMGCRVTVVPATTPAGDVLAMNPDGVLLSNGPGDPEPVTYAATHVRQILGKVPIFGICLGHQILSLACGAKTYKLKFGHHGANHPVKNLATGRVEITSQNHGFAVDESSLPDTLELTHVNLNDRTVSGIRVKNVSAFSVQYHPEAAPGPHDSSYLFEQFTDSMRQWRSDS